VLGHLEAACRRADFPSYLGLAEGGLGPPGDRSGDARKDLLRRVEKLVSLSFAFFGKKGIEAGDESFARIFRRGNLDKSRTADERRAEIHPMPGDVFNASVWV
jgi:hypothetical protein